MTKIKLSQEETQFLSDIFKFKTNTELTEVPNFNICLETETPSVLSTILNGSKLTLLAEISHYQLWFPMELKIDESGEIRTILSTPEVMDVDGLERSWRVETPEDITVLDENAQEVEVLSLSTTGLTMRFNPEKCDLHKVTERTLQIHLPDVGMVDIDIVTVRKDSNVVAAKFANLSDATKESIRLFLFDLHRSTHAHLYSKTA